MRGEIKKTREAKYKEFKGIWQNYSRILVMKKLRIKYVTYEYFLAKAITAMRVEGEEPLIYSEKQPFSENENDYGRPILWSMGIQNTPIEEKEITDLRDQIEEHKLILKLNSDGRNVEHADKKESNSESALLNVGYN